MWMNLEAWNNNYMNGGSDNECFYKKIPSYRKFTLLKIPWSLNKIVLQFHLYPQESWNKLTVVQMNELSNIHVLIESFFISVSCFKFSMNNWLFLFIESMEQRRNISSHRT